MKTIILAGGLGTRISEETSDKPKPMVNIDSKPILWHLMGIYASQGFREFILALGYKGEVIRRWLLDLHELSENMTVDLTNGHVRNWSENKEIDWLIHAVETGLNTQTAGRIKRSMECFPNETMMATYGDGLGNVNLKDLIDFHKSHKKLVTVTAVRPPARFGHMELDGNKVLHFGEKNQSDAGWINGGFFVIEPSILKYINSDSEAFEKDVLPKLAKDNELMAFYHEGFWQPMDTLSEKKFLESQAKMSPPPWLHNI